MARTVPEPVGLTLNPSPPLSATNVFDTARRLDPLGGELDAVTGEIADGTVLDRHVPAAGESHPGSAAEADSLTVRPRRLIRSSTPALMLMPTAPPDTRMPASPTPSLMMLMVLVMFTAP